MKRYAILMWCVLTLMAVGAAAQTVTGSGTTNTVPVFTGTSTVGNSPISVSGSNVGIGTTNPSAQLHVVNGTGIEIQSSNARLEFGDIASAMNLRMDNSGNLEVTNVNNSPSVHFAQGGYVGIGTTTPQYILDVDGPIAIEGVPVMDKTSIATPSDGSYVIASGVRIHGEYIVSWGETANRVQTVHLLVNADQYDVSSTLQIEENHSYLGTVVLSNFRLLMSANGATVYLVMTVGNRNGGTTVNAQYQGTAYYGASWGGTLVGTEVSTGVVGFVSNEGNVGIGTTSPGAKLEVNGGLRFTSDPSGTVQTTAWTGVLCGGDYSEAVDASGDPKHYEPGDVLILGSGDDGEVEKSSEPYSTMVTGIFATKPGVIGRRETLPKSAQEIPMAMVGIVPTKVSAENGPIHRGDLLVSSSTPGYAMKGTDRNRMLGAVIGKAMGSLDSGTGVIEVVVTLQ